MSVRIIVDSTTDMTPAVAARVKLVHLTVRFGQEELVDGVDINTQQFYTRLTQSDELPTTSQPTPYAFVSLFSEAVAAGEDVVCITISSKLSGTYQSATIAAENFPGRVFVVDSQNVTIGASVLTEYALKLVDDGLSAEEIAMELQRQREKIHLFAVVDTLEYLKKGGRISAAVAFTGGLLNIKPILAIEDGELKLVGKARGNKQAGTQLAKLIGETGGIDFEKPLLFGYTGLEDTLLRQYMEENAGLWYGSCDLPYTVVGSVVGTHAGPGAIAVAFFKKH